MFERPQRTNQESEIEQINWVKTAISQSSSFNASTPGDIITGESLVNYAIDDLHGGSKLQKKELK